MLVFVDESGDTGLKLAKGSSACFVVTAVIFADREAALQCNEAINGLRQKHGLEAPREFKFNKCSRETREDFLRVVCAYPFQYHSVVLNKAKLSGVGFRHKDSHYKYTVRLVFENARPV